MSEFGEHEEPVAEPPVHLPIERDPQRIPPASHEDLIEPELEPEEDLVEPELEGEDDVEPELEPETRPKLVINRNREPRPKLIIKK